ncbi:MAG: 3-hydroxyanthranilate 3,4-dioxygenase [Deltaproteobacteria bacterium]|nr:MAG: 3-hydroxyanthranilate 3,4-dioxygenase [Deltaproteobacteria bacterium]
MAILPPFNLHQWIDEHRHLLKPPVGNQEVYPGEDFIVMVVGGPNTRKDYHIDPGPEFFYQVEGDMTLRIVEDGTPKDIEIREGEVFYLPPFVPHSPQRRPDTVGLVIERKRLEGEEDGLRWYCESCHHVLHEEFFALEDIVAQLRGAIERFHASEEARTCANCGAVMAAPR